MLPLWAPVISGTQPYQKVNTHTHKINNLRRCLKKNNSSRDDTEATCCFLNEVPHDINNNNFELESWIQIQLFKL